MVNRGNERLCGRERRPQMTAEVVAAALVKTPHWRLRLPRPSPGQEYPERPSGLKRQYRASPGLPLPWANHYGAWDVLSCQARPHAKINVSAAIIIVII